MSYRSKQPGAFTIMEMIVVIAIISLIMSFLLPAMGMARTQARTVQGLAHLNQLGKSINIYSVDNRNILPYGYDGTPGNDSDWTTVVDGYLTGDSSTYAENEETSDVFRCPNATYLNQGRSHYSAHPVLMPDITPTASPEFPLYKVSRFRRPNELILLMDGAQRTADDPIAPYTTFATAWRLDAPEFLTTNPWFSKSDADNNDAINPGPNHDNGGTANGNIRWRQEANQGANFLYVDTHAVTHRIGHVKRRNIRADQ